jgi:protein required for attachment to host cells
MKKLVKGAWVVVADEDKALVVTNTGDAVLPVLQVTERIDTKDLLAVADRSARGRDHKQHETVEPPDYHRMAGATLAGAVAAHLRKAHAAGAFESLVLVAPPQVLGALRDALGDDLASVTLAEFAKTLTGHPMPKIARILAEDLSEL